MKTILKAYKILNPGRIKNAMLRYGRVKKGIIEIANGYTALKMKCPVKNANGKLIHIPTLEKCVKLDFENVSYKEGKLIDNESGVSIDMPDYADVSDFPTYQYHFKEEKTKEIDFNYKDVEAVSKACAVNRSRYAINSVAVFENGCMAATDGYRMHISGTLPEENNAVMLDIIIVKLAKLLKLDCKLSTNKKYGYVVLNGDFGQLSLKLAQGKYPDIKMVIPKKAQPLNVNVEKLLLVLKRIKKVHKDGEPISVKFEGCLSWNGINFPMDLPKGLNHIFNFHYLIDALEAVKPEFLQFTDDPTSPIRIQNGNKMAVLTPIHIIK